MTNTYNRHDPAHTRIGVVCGSIFYIWDGDNGGNAAPFNSNVVDYTLPMLANIGLIEQLTAIWLVPAIGTEPAPGDWLSAADWTKMARPDELNRAMNAYTWKPLSAGRESRSVAGLVVRRRGHDGQPTGRELRIHAPWVGDAWGVRHYLAQLGGSCTDRATTFAQGIMLAQHALQHRLGYSPSYTGLDLLRATLDQWARRGVDLSPLSDDLQDMICGLEPKDIIWARALEEDEEYGGLIYKHDRNMSYVSSSGEVPVGVPVPTTDFQPGCIGVYLVRGLAPPLVWDMRQPCPLPTVASMFWAWEPQIRLAKRLGWVVIVHQGYYWPKSQKHAAMRLWKERIWGARQLIADKAAEHPIAAGIAATIVKRAGVSAIGRLKQSRGLGVVSADEAEEQGLDVRRYEEDAKGHYTGMATVEMAVGRQDLIHPEWRAHIISNSMERAQHILYTYGPCIIGIYYDAVYSTRPIPDLAGSPLKVGGWKAEGPPACIPRNEWARDGAGDGLKLATLYNAYREADRIYRESSPHREADHG